MSVSVCLVINVYISVLCVYSCFKICACLHTELMSAGIGDAVDEDDEGTYVCPLILRAYELAKKHEAYIACRVPSQSNSIAKYLS